MVIEVAELVRYADDVEATARLISADSGPLSDYRKSLLETTGELRARSRDPLRIAVAGHFSCGKSLLLGTLVGRPDLLAVGRVRATAVVTLLEVSQSEDAVRTEAAWRLEFLSPEGFDDMLGYLAGCLVEAAAVSRAPASAVAALRRLTEGETAWSSDQKRLEELDAWCRQQSGPEVENRLRRVSDEVGRLVRAWFEYRQYVGAPPMPVSAAAGRGLSAHRDGTSAPAVPAAAMPLVDRVVIDVQVPAEVWNLSAMQDENRLWLIDLPGMNADEATERDRYLARRELRKADTLLALMDARTGATSVLDELIAMLDEQTDPGDPGRSAAVLPSRVLVAVNRFDELEHSASAFAELDRAAPLTLGHVLESFDTLASLDRLARRVMQGGIDRRVALTSAMLGIADLTTRDLAALEPRSAAELNVAEAVEDARRKAGQWHAVAERLRAAAPHGAMEKALHEFAKDGGLDGLRSMIAAHVQENGLLQRRDALARIARRLHGQAARTREALRADETEADPVLRGRAEEIRTLINEVAGRFEGLREDIPGRLQDPVQVELADGRTLLEAIRQEAAFAVFSWHEWVPLIDSAKDGQVRIDDHETAPPWDDDDDEDDDRGYVEEELEAPRTTAELREPYERTVAMLDAHVGELTDQIVRSWVEEQHEGMREARTGLMRLVPRSLLDEVDDKGVQGRFGNLHDMAELYRLERTVDRALAQPASEPASQAFPLRAKSSLPWDPARPASTEEKTDRHFIRLLRIRRELIEALVRRACQQAESRQARLVPAIRSYVARRQSRYRIPSSSDADALVRFLRGDGSAAPTPADLADQLAAIPVPRGVKETDAR